MDISTAITVVLVGLIIVMLPFWKYSRHWGGGYKISGIEGAMLAVHIYGSSDQVPIVQRTEQSIPLEWGIYKGAMPPCSDIPYTIISAAK